MIHIVGATVSLCLRVRCWCIPSLENKWDTLSAAFSPITSLYQLLHAPACTLDRLVLKILLDPAHSSYICFAFTFWYSTPHFNACRSTYLKIHLRNCSSHQRHDFQLEIHQVSDTIRMTRPDQTRCEIRNEREKREREYDDEQGRIHYAGCTMGGGLCCQGAPIYCTIFTTLCCRLNVPMYAV